MENTADHLRIINQLHEIEKKLNALAGAEGIQRNVTRIKGYFADMGYRIHNPQAEPYPDTRTDCEASIMGTSSENLFVDEVIKPIVHFDGDGDPRIIQKGVVIVKSHA
jgi:hypothetical protein